MRWVAARYPSIKASSDKSIDLHPNQSASRDSEQTLPTSTPLTQPYWLRASGTPGLFHVDDPSLIGRPENSPVFPIQQVFEVGGETLVIADQPMAVTNDSAGKETHRRLDVIPPVSLHFNSEVTLFSPDSSHSVEIELTAARANSSGTLRLETPSDWKVTPATQKFSLAQAGDKAQFKFSVTAPAKSTTAKIGASAEVHGVRYEDDRMAIHYAHIPLQLLQPPAAEKCGESSGPRHSWRRNWLPSRRRR